MRSNLDDRETLPGAAAHRAPGLRDDASAAPPRGKALNIVFVCYTNFLSNSAIQMFHLSNALVQRGHRVTCIVPPPISTVTNCGEPRFEVVSDADLTNDDGARLRLTPDIIHAWTPREGVRKKVEFLAARYRRPYAVHLEDNEDYVFATFSGLPLEGLSERSEQELDPFSADNLSHPVRSRRFLANSCGVTLLIDGLADFVPASVPTDVFYPSCDESAFYPRPIDYARRRQLGVDDEDFLITYNGNAHSANFVDMRGLYAAVGLCNHRGGRTVKLLRLGVTDGVDLYGAARALIEPFVVDLGSRPHHEQAPHLALADGLVQPGRPDMFNDYRFPSKLPEFFRMGKPVVLPRSNIGLALTDGVEALLLNSGTALELADKIDLLRSDGPLCDRLAASITSFSSRFSWANAAAIVERTYRRAIPDQ